MERITSKYVKQLDAPLHLSDTEVDASGLPAVSSILRTVGLLLCSGFWSLTRRPMQPFPQKSSQEKQNAERNMRLPKTHTLLCVSLRHYAKVNRRDVPTAYTRNSAWQSMVKQ